MILKSITKKMGLMGAILMILPLVAYPQNSSEVDSATVFYVVSGFMFIVLVIILSVLILLLRVLQYVLEERQAKKVKEQGLEIPEKENWWAKFLTKANEAVPVEEEESILLDHNYDGIKELDNHLPPWWTWMFYLSIAFSFVYLFVYHISGTLPLQMEEYNQEIALAEAEMKARMANLPESTVDENNVQLVTDPAQLAKGKQVYVNNCAPCHKETGAGGIGPNLTDDYWLHGGSINEIYKTIKVGVPEKGMISWEPVLSPNQMQNVASFVVGLKGTNPPNAKAPQGELYVPESKEEEMGVEKVSDTTNIAEVAVVN